VPRPSGPAWQQPGLAGDAVASRSAPLRPRRGTARSVVRRSNQSVGSRLGDGGRSSPHAAAALRPLLSGEGGSRQQTQKQPSPCTWRPNATQAVILSSMAGASHDGHLPLIVRAQKPGRDAVEYDSTGPEAALPGLGGRRADTATEGPLGSRSEMLKRIWRFAATQRVPQTAVPVVQWARSARAPAAPSTRRPVEHQMEVNR
jgi:hypothetical protein